MPKAEQNSHSEIDCSDAFFIGIQGIRTTPLPLLSPDESQKFLDDLEDGESSPSPSLVAGFAARKRNLERLKGLRE